MKKPYNVIINNHRKKEDRPNGDNYDIYLKESPDYKVVIKELIKAVPAYQWVLGSRRCK